ncbi:MAG: metal dependent phosphohydrolase [Gemmatimonadetes bacterium]|nr:metal dependent phosphohydrolase [Gemmatimonadota bacterium]
MTDPVPFLNALSQALATMNLYTEGHPARERSTRAGYGALLPLLEAEGEVRFSFLSGDVVFGNRVLRELKDWEWSRRLAAIGIERMEIVPPVPYEEFDRFVRLVHERLRVEGSPAAVDPSYAPTGIRYGRVALGGESIETLADQTVVATVSFSLAEEVEAVQWLHDEAEHKDTVPLVETETIVRSLAVAMHQEGQVVLPLLSMKEFDQYTTTHSCNVAVLAMGLAEYLGYAPREVRALGVAALLHDIGKVKLSGEVLRKEGKYTPEERAEIERHPVEGARLILARHRHLDLAAVVAYEHHLWYAGGGYPRLTFPREPHYASRVVQVCDVYDALLSRRPYREAFAPEAALGILLEGSGRIFDPDLVQAMTTMLRQARARQVSVDAATVEVTAVQSPGG